MTRRKLLLGLLPSLVTAGALSRRAAVAGPVEGSELLAAGLELVVLRSRLGDAHPRVVALRERIRALEAEGAAINLEEAEREMAGLFRRRAELRRHFGLHHPDVLAATRQIGHLAVMLAGPLD